ncbi:Proliferating cell nuclear antigen [Smittium culicis]|uniref:DNA sliding clamp PCNA n=3 Tax=Smittium culicis TaxID=133412 RepID=A0A1R1Y3Z3_9FUNG|nr:Proliferating cell nuclear antigen [Smittium culicis]OMJ13374.1 Proliferating cell nuclear antigen [Smittium culicis]OMJ20252.1 Proliferating cell nuclear antigen [Smittium culicis]OMJ21697.1 Proliferating cell nuclear antigen [Smittium culicis]OMJ25303.1 Proliferating cell nuclear antigen [Smittium culicis]
MLEARLPQASILKKIVESVKDLVSQANFDCSESGISFQAMDESNIALSSFLLRADGFDPYRCDRNLSLGIKFSTLSKILKCAGNDDVVIIKYEDDDDILSLVFKDSKNERISEFSIKLLDIDSEYLSIPEQEFECKVSMSSSEFSRICRDLMTIGSSVVIDATKEGVKFSSTGDEGNGSVLLKQSGSIDDDGKRSVGTTVQMTEPVSLELSLKYLNNFTKASPLSDSVSINMSNGIPVLFQFDVGDIGYIRYFLAPQIKDDE